MQNNRYNPVQKPRKCLIVIWKKRYILLLHEDLPDFPVVNANPVMDYGQRNLHFLSPEVPILLYISEVYLHKRRWNL